MLSASEQFGAGNDLLRWSAICKCEDKSRVS